MKKILIALLGLFLIIFPFACNDDDDDDDNGNGDHGNVVTVSDDIDVVTTWYADSVYIIESNDLWVTSTLTIQPGTLIKFKAGCYMSASADGTVIAIGTDIKPIIFTSVKDDAHGGDHNGDGDVTSPAPGNWGCVLIEGNGSKFNYCRFYYGGGGSYLSSLEIYDATAEIIHCTFAMNKGGKSGSFHYGALDVSSALPATVVRQNVFYGNILPLSIETSISIDNTNIFHNPDDPLVINTMNGIFVSAVDDISTAVSWDETEVPFVNDTYDWWIDAGGSLTLAATVILKFTADTYLVIGTGAELNYNSTNIFTSIKDDAHGGDTNGDGTATLPSAGDWGGLYNDDTGLYLSDSNILYSAN
jgi:hypothetical protein